MNRLRTGIKGASVRIEARRPHAWTSRVFGLWVAFLAASAFADPATLTGSQPFRLIVDPAGKAQKISVEGTNFENNGHPNRDEYMHWQVRRADGSWEKCGRLTSQCQTAGWSNNTESFQIGGAYVAQSGFVELRFFHGLALENANDPSQAANLWSDGWSNVLRIPVVVPASAPTISSLSKKEFPLAGTGNPDDYRFMIDASGVKDQGAVAVVFRGDVVVGPERIHDGHLIQVSVPEVYRLKTAGELPLTLRTDKGGESARVYIRFKEPPKMALKQVPLGSNVAVASVGTQGGGGFVPRGAAVEPAAGMGAPIPTAMQKPPVAPITGPRPPIAATDYITPQGQRARGEVRGNRLYLQGNANPAPDGTYRRVDGTSIIVQGGLIVQDSAPAGAARTGGFATPGGVKAISPAPGAPAGLGAAGPQAAPLVPGVVREPGGVKAIGPKQDDPSAPGKAAAMIAPGKLDASAGPGTVGAPTAGGSGVPGGVREPGGVKAIGPKQDDPSAPGKLGAPGVMAPLNMRSVQPQPMSQ